MVTSENEQHAEPEATTARDVYRQAREQAAQVAGYDVQAALERLSSWMEEGSAEYSGGHVVPPNPARQPHGKRRRASPPGEGDSAISGEAVGYRGPTACLVAGITYRQLDYWARTGLVEPSVRGASGRGSQRLYSFRDILILKMVKRLLDTGIPLNTIRAAVDHLRDRGLGDLAQVTLMSDGVDVYECTSPDEIVDLLAGGQGIFGIALGRVWQEVAGELAELPEVHDDDELVADLPFSSADVHRRAEGIA